MRSIQKLAVLAGAGVAALALAGNALATQSMAVSQTSGAVTIKISQAQTDPQPARIIVYVPTGYTLTTNQTAGSVIGTTSGEVFARDLNIPLPLQGNVIVDNPASHLLDQCAAGVHQAVWILNLSVAGQTIALPLYVDPTAGAEAALGSAKLVLCLGPSDVPAGTPGRSPNGAQLLSATFTVNGALTPPSGSSRWIAFTTPYSPGIGVPNAAGTVETRSFVGPGTITLGTKVTNKRKKLVRMSGQVKQSGLSVAARVTLLVNGKAKGTATAAATGRYLKTVKGSGKRSTFQARVTVPARDITATGCTAPTQAPVPCVSATAGGFTATSPKRIARF